MATYVNNVLIAIYTSICQNLLVFQDVKHKLNSDIYLFQRAYRMATYVNNVALFIYE